MPKKGTVAGWEFELAHQNTPAETGERLAEELRDDAADQLEEQNRATVADVGQNDGVTGSATTQGDVASRPSQISRSEQVARAYLAEGLVFQELQREFGGTVQREVRVGPYAVDGIVFGPSGPVAVEVKLISSGKAIRTRLVDAGARLLQLSSLGGNKYSNIRPLLAIVVENMDDASNNWRRRLREFSSEFSSIDTRIFLLEDLLNKYGLTEAYN